MCVFFFKQKTAYEMRIRDWSSDVGSSDLATVAACAGFGAICGSAIATAATMCRVALPEMRRHGYADSLATASIAAGGTLGILIPPSIILLIYALLTEQSLGKLFIAALVPGLLGTVQIGRASCRERVCQSV